MSSASPGDACCWDGTQSPRGQGPQGEMDSLLAAEPGVGRGSGAISFWEV